MHFLKQIFLTVGRLAKQVWTLPQSIAAGFQHRRQRITRNEAEAERLDRIRHPYKYRGK